MTTLNDISTKLNVIASEIGSGHVSYKDAEVKIRNVSKEVFELAFEIRKYADMMLPFSGLSEQCYKILLRNENIEQNNRGGVSE